METEQRTKDVLVNAVAYRASDVHLVPLEKIGVVRFRIDGQLVEMECIPLKTMLKMISHLKFISGMDVGERRRPQNSSMEIPVLQKSYSMRLSTFPSSFHETLVIRLFPQETQTLQQLSLFPKQAKHLLELANSPAGLLIVCGPTGSGKTTTLYSLLQACFMERHRNIITLEDPVEQKHSNFLQMEINERAGITYATGLKSLLRHDPDIIMIGEIRDRETAQMAIRAALTGHFVLSTLHSKDTLSGIKRLYELGISTMDLKESVKAIVSQRLVDLVCPYCEGGCNPFCKKLRTRRRVAVFEILANDQLKMSVADMNMDFKLKGSLLDNLNKGIALGFVNNYEYERMGKG
ncbi:MAG: GspE/PulE family protein [Bacillus sp. (in: Bacteria)]|nr:GspE/PulE family protein [Bacillus sp. (in: firmicutes)]